MPIHHKHLEEMKGKVITENQSSQRAYTGICLAIHPSIRPYDAAAAFEVGGVGPLDILMIHGDPLDLSLLGGISIQARDIQGRITIRRP